jgi:hypothetical protein
MRTAWFVLSFCFAAGAGCGGPQPSATPVPAGHTDLVAASDPQEICPYICGEGTPCQMPDGTCREACNPCLCEAYGGTVVAACASE